MPVVQSLMDNLVAKYGKERGERVYYAMEASARGPFAPGAKHHALHVAFAQKHGLEPFTEPTKKARPARKAKRASSPRRGR